MKTFDWSMIYARLRKLACLGAALTVLATSGGVYPTDAEARGFGRGGGFRGGGGYRSVSRTTVSRGAYGRGVATRTTARSGYAYGRARVATLPARNVTAAGVARRTARRTVRNNAYAWGTAANYGYASGYYYGAAVSQPSGCVSTIFEGQTALDCNGVIYIADYSSGQVMYYPVQ